MPNPCLNGAECIEDLFGSYECKCPPGVQGTNCEFVNSATFTGSSYILTPNPQGFFPVRRRKRQVDLGEFLVRPIGWKMTFLGTPHCYFISSCVKL